jgi:hypothetical protein
LFLGLWTLLDAYLSAVSSHWQRIDAADTGAWRSLGIGPGRQIIVAVSGFVDCTATTSFPGWRTWNPLCCSGRPVNMIRQHKNSPFRCEAGISCYTGERWAIREDQTGKLLKNMILTRGDGEIIGLPIVLDIAPLIGAKLMLADSLTIKDLLKRAARQGVRKPVADPLNFAV